MEKLTSRPIRNRKNSRKSWSQNGDKGVKRLFTPEIKRLLKDWLVRRRENPYPSREEKKTLAQDTGLTYTQICNWFANWRRKLKNTSNQKKSWGNLIRSYNFSAKGNVEQFSISSNDSIWGEGHKNDDSLDDSSSMDDSEAQDLSQGSERKFNASIAHGPNFMLSSSPFFQAANFMAQAQCFQISSTTNDFQFQQQFPPDHKQFFTNSTKFKNHIMEKYLRGLDDEAPSNNNNNNHDNNNDTEMDTSADANKKPELSKWLESTANFMPSNYNIDFMKNDRRKKNNNNSSLCEKELLAAETLVLLKNNFRTKFYNS